MSHSVQLSEIEAKRRVSILFWAEYDWRCPLRGRGYSYSILHSLVDFISFFFELVFSGSSAVRCTQCRPGAGFCLFCTVLMKGDLSYMAISHGRLFRHQLLKYGSVFVMAIIEIYLIPPIFFSLFDFTTRDSLMPAN